MPFQLTSASSKKKWIGWIIFSLGLTLSWLFYASPYIRSYLKFGTFNFETTAFYFPDRLFNFSLAQTAKSVGINFLDPLNRTYPVFYQQFLYWLWGSIASLTDSQPWAVANLLQILTPLLFFIVFYILALQVLRESSLAFLSSLFIFWFKPLKYSMQPFGVHAIILPFGHLISGSYSDSYGVLFGSISIMFFLKLIREPTLGKNQRLLYSVFFVLFSTFCFLTQFLCFLFFAALLANFLFFRNFPATFKRRSLLVWLPMVLAGGALISTGTHLAPMWALGAAGLAAVLLPYLRDQDRRPYFLLMGSLALTGIYIGVNLWLVKQSGLDPFQYQTGVRALDLAIPPLVALKSHYPLLIFCCIALGVQSSSSYFYWGTFITAVILCFNHSFGYNNHPYRFFPFAFPFLVITAFGGLKAWFKLPKKIILGSCPALLLLAFPVLSSMKANYLSFRDFFQNYTAEVSKDRLELSEKLEKLRMQKSDSMVYLSPQTFRSFDLAPYTGIKFYDSTFLSWGRRNTGNLAGDLYIDELVSSIQSNQIPVDWIVVRNPCGKNGICYQPFDQSGPYYIFTRKLVKS